MHTIMGNLPATKSFKHRTYTYIPMSTGWPFHIGVLEVRESKSPDSRAVVSRYAIREIECDRPGRAFRLTKPGGTVWYTVCIHPDELDECECRGHEAFGVCKHTQTVRELIRQEVLR